MDAVAHGGRRIESARSLKPRSQPAASVTAKDIAEDPHYRARDVTVTILKQVTRDGHED